MAVYKVKPLLGEGQPQEQSDWNESDNSKVSFIKNKPNLATVATSGSYNDLTDKPTIPSEPHLYKHNIKFQVGDESENYDLACELLLTDSTQFNVTSFTQYIQNNYSGFVPQNGLCIKGLYSDHAAYTIGYYENKIKMSYLYLDTGASADCVGLYTFNAPIYTVNDTVTQLF